MAARRIIAPFLSYNKNIGNIFQGKYFNFRFTQLRKCASTSPQLDKAMCTVTFVTREGEQLTVKGKEGDSLFDIVKNNQLDFDGFGACDGSLSCSTCHVILKAEDYNRLSGPISEEENDMLDLADELTETSRLGCQVIMTKDLDGLVARLPKLVRDMRDED